MNKEELLAREESAFAELLNAREEHSASVIHERSLKREWEDHYAQLVLQEDKIAPPAGKRWNETLRAIHIDGRTGLKVQLDEAKDNTSYAYLRLKQAETEYEHIGRIISIYTD